MRPSLRVAACFLAVVSPGCVPAAGDRGIGSSAAAIPDPFRVELVGRDRRWLVRYPAPPGSVRGSGEGLPLGDLHVPTGRNVVLVLKSQDFIYTFEIPRHGLKEIAAPELEFRVAFRVDRSERFDYLGEPMCSDPHNAMSGRVIAEPPDIFLAWLRSRQSVPAAPSDGSAAPQ